LIHKIRQLAGNTALAAHIASAVASVPFVNRMTFSKSAILQRFQNFYTLRVEIFRNFFRSSLRMTPMNREKFHGNRSARFSEIRSTDTQTNRRGNFMYIEEQAHAVQPQLTSTHCSNSLNYVLLFTESKTLLNAVNNHL